MKSDTLQCLKGLIQETPGIRPKDILQHFSFQPTGIFKHLKHLQTERVIYKIGRPPEVRYYTYASMENVSHLLNNAINWAMSGDERWAPPDALSSTRDVFQARADHLVYELQQRLNNQDVAFLIVAVVGEIGNNSFDHNLGHWRDTTGVYFHNDSATREIVLADRGQGVFATIKRVKPEVKNDADALRVAFTERISGRAPEKRGNGLKFVKKVITEQSLCLHYYTGDAMAEISASKFTIKPSPINVPGTVAYLKF